MKNLMLKDIQDKILYIEDINEGLKNCNNAMLVINIDEAGEESFMNFLLDMKESKGNVVVDYYGNIINYVAFDRMLKTLNEEQSEYLIQLRNKNEKEIFYSEVDGKFLRTLIKLSLNEILFSSFYLGNELTIWGNYNGKFVMFFNKESNFEEINNLAEKNNLIIEDFREV